MKWTDSFISSLDREGQIQALHYAEKCMRNLEELQRQVSIADQNIENLKQTVENMKKGPTAKKLALVGVAIFIVGSLVLGAGTAFNLLIFVGIAYLIADKSTLSKKRIKEAEEYFADNISSLQADRTNADSALRNALSSEDAYNTMLLIPKEFFSSDIVHALSELIERRRARSLSEAMMVYESQAHQKKMEAYEAERLKAAQETARAQQQAAIAAQNAERHAREAAADQKRILRNQERSAATPQIVYRDQPSKGFKGKSKTCFSCKMAIPKKAQTCPYCNKSQLRTPLETLLGTDSAIDRKKNEWWY